MFSRRSVSRLHFLAAFAFGRSSSQPLLADDPKPKAQTDSIKVAHRTVKIDGLDIFLVGKIAPAIAHGLGETPAAMTLVFFCQQIGLAIGAFAATPLADRFGRRRMLIFCSAIFGAVDEGVICGMPAWA